MAQIKIGNEFLDKMYNATLDSDEDQDREWRRQVLGATMRWPIRRTQTITDGVFLGASSVLGGVGRTGDYLNKIQWEVGTSGPIGGAGLWLSMPLDPVVTSGVTGSAITNTAAQTFTTGFAFNATKNQYTGRVVSFTYVPTGGVATVFITRIVSHNAWNSTSIPMVLEDTPPAGAAPTAWAVEGVMSRRICEPGRAAGFYEWTGPEVSNYGGFIVRTGGAVIEAHAFGDFT